MQEHEWWDRFLTLCGNNLEDVNEVELESVREHFLGCLRTWKAVADADRRGYLDDVERLDAELQQWKKATQLCKKHRPSGGTRSMCVICSGEHLQSALSRIDYLLGEPNEYGVSDYDLHYDEEAVVKRVAALLDRETHKTKEDSI